MSELWLQAIRSPKPIKDYEASYVIQMTLPQIYMVRKILLDPCHAGTHRESACTKANQLLVETWYKDRHEDADGNIVFLVEVSTLMCSVVKKATIDYLRVTLDLQQEGVLTPELFDKISTMPESKRTEYLSVISNILMTFTSLEAFFCGLMEMEDMVDRGLI